MRINTRFKTVLSFIYGLAIGVPLIIWFYSMLYPAIPKQTIELPSALKEYFIVGEFDDGTRLLNAAVHGIDLQERFVLLDDTDWSYLNFPEDTTCTRLYYSQPKILTGKQILFIKLCEFDKVSPRTGYSLETNAVIYDIETHELRLLTQNPFWGRGVASWNPELSRGVATAGSLAETLYWITPEKWEPIPAVVSHKGQTWALDEAFDTLIHNRSVRWMGNAKMASWSPDGQRILFWAMPEAMGKEGIGRAYAPHYLFELDLQGTSTQVVWETGVTSAGLIVWQPTQSWVLFSGAIGWRKGLWMVNVDTQEKVFIDKAEYSEEYLWTDDGNSVIFGQCLDLYCDRTEIFKYDVSSFLSP